MAKYSPITKTKSKNEVFDLWLKRIEQIEELMGDGEDMNIAFDVAFIVFPLLDSISFNLFKKNAHKYLQELGLTAVEAAVLVQVFRNGLIHNLASYDLEYVDGKVSWGILSSGGTGGIRPYDTGYQDDECPEYNIPPEKVFEYEDFSNDLAMATLYLDRLIALIRHDLQQRKESYTEETIEFIVGQKVAGEKPRISK